MSKTTKTTKTISTTGSGNKTVKSFEIILYPDATNYEFLNKLYDVESYCYDHEFSFWWIRHDQDVKDDGSPVKTHIHFLVYCNGTTTTLGAICKDLELEENEVQFKNYISSSIKYLCHQSTNSGDKVIYDWHDITTNDMKRLKSVYENLDENMYIRSLISWIDNQEIIYFRDFVDYVLKENLWSYYRRSASIMKELINEHNMYKCEKEKLKQV